MAGWADACLDIPGQRNTTCGRRHSPPTVLALRLIPKWCFHCVKHQIIPMETEAFARDVASQTRPNE